MTTRLLLAAVATVAWAGGPGAQQNPPSAPDGSHVVLTGCLEHADEVKPNITNDTTVDSLTFVLTRAVTATSSPSAAPKVVGTTGTLPRTYRLDASVEKLGSHVGQQVEITGSLAERPTAPAGAGSTANVPRVRVDSVKVIDATCPR